MSKTEKMAEQSKWFLAFSWRQYRRTQENAKRWPDCPFFAEQFAKAREHVRKAVGFVRSAA